MSIASKADGLKAVLSQANAWFTRTIGWKRVGLVLSIALISFAIATLIKLLKGVDSSLIVVAMTNMSAQQVGLAALCVLGAYFTLTFYDLFALRTIGRTHVPYRIAALSSFTSYSIGHNIGATVFTGGAIRYRIYSAWGLNAIDVAKICFISGLTFWLGNTFVLGLGMTYHPGAAGAIDQLPEWMNRIIGLGGLVSITLYLIWLSLKPRELGRNGWKVTLPSAPLTILQILIGVVDLGFCALAMKILMPAAPHIDFMSLAVVFILATLLGFASHAPGSIGVLDAALLIALPQFVKEELLATLLVFRLLYFIIPFSTAVSLMGLREIWINIILPWQERRRNLTPPGAATIAVPRTDKHQPHS